MPLTKKIWIHAITLALQVNVYAVWGMEVAHINTLSTNGAISTRSWKTLRDFRVVKQSFDYSCGSSAIATILNQFYQQTVTELDILKAIDKGNSITSFDDMERAVPQFGFRAVGYAASFEQITKLKIPVIVYLKYRGDDHFSVVRGINADTVWLADSSLGNRYLSRHQFLAMWGGKDSAKQNGKILVILADRSDLIESRDFFTINPKRPTALAISLQLQRNFFR